jgi:hypothetical protein
MLDLRMGWSIYALLLISSPAVLLVSEQPLFYSVTFLYRITNLTAPHKVVLVLVSCSKWVWLLVSSYFRWNQGSFHWKGIIG